MKSLVFSLLASLSTAVLTSGPAMAELDKSRVQRAPATIDLREKINSAKFAEGENILFENENVRLVANVAHGKIVSVKPVKLAAVPMRQTTQSGIGGRPCIACFFTGDVVRSFCLELPCWVIPIITR